eukprot:1122819-Prymnesium_polylepis.1
MRRAARELQQIAAAQAGGLNQQAAATLQQALLDLLAQEDASEGEEPSEDRRADERGETGASGEDEERVLVEAAAC